MVRIDQMLFGYFRVIVDASDKAKAADILLKNGFGAAFSNDGSFIVSLRRLSVVERIFANKVSYSVLGPRGLYGLFLNNKKRIGIFCGLAVSLILFFLSTRVVWDVRIEGDFEYDEKQILNELSDAGLKVGEKWSSIEESEIENKVLLSSVQTTFPCWIRLH